MIKNSFLKVCCGFLPIFVKYHIGYSESLACNEGNSALGLACGSESPSSRIIVSLISHGADLDLGGKYTQPLLTFVNCDKVAKILLENGADPEPAIERLLEEDTQNEYSFVNRDAAVSLCKKIVTILLYCDPENIVKHCTRINQINLDYRISKNNIFNRSNVDLSIIINDMIHGLTEKKPLSEGAKMVIFNRAKGEVSNLCMPGKFIDEMCENQHSLLSTKDALESNNRLSQLRNNLQELKQYLLPDTHLSDNQVSSIGGGQVLY